MSEEKDFLALEGEIVRALKNVFDPEIPVNVFDLGLIYEIDVNETREVQITMTLTTPNCPVADDVLREVEQFVGQVPGVEKVEVNLTFDPPWDQTMLSDEAKLELGLL